VPDAKRGRFGSRGSKSLSIIRSGVGKLTDPLRAHLIRDRMPLTLVASSELCPVGTATLLAHDVGTEQWPELSPWLAAVYVAPEYRHRGIVWDGRS